MAKKKLTPEYGLTLSQDANPRGGLIQNILDSIDENKKDFYAQLAPSFGGRGGVSISDMAKNFVRKNADDKVLGNLDFHQSIKSDNYSSGALGSGWKMYKDTYGNGVLEIDKISVRKELLTQMLTYEKINAIGGTLLLSSAWCTVYDSSIVLDGGDTRIRIRFKPDGSSLNLWQIDDNIKCQSGLDKFLMSYVTSLSNELDSDGCYYIDLFYTETPSSATDYFQLGNYVPQSGDVIVQHGHRGEFNESRKNIILMSVGDAANAYPYIEQYKDVTGFTTDGKLITRISDDVYFGRADKTRYLWWNKNGDGELLLNGALTQTNEDDAGFPATSFKGEWSNETTYYRGDIVYYLGSLYVMIDINPSYDDEPSGLVSWAIYVQKGDNAVSVVMNNQAVVLPANESGVVTDYTNAWAQIRVFDPLELTYDGVGTSNGTYKVINITGTNITVGSISSWLDYFQITGHSAFLDGFDYASIQYTITGKSNTGIAFTRILTQNFSKSKAGSTGSSGLNARAVSLNTTRQAWEYNSDGDIIGTPSAMTATVTATALNTAPVTVYYQFVLAGTPVQNTTSNQYIYTPQASTSNMPQSIVVNIREGSNSGTILASDTITMYGVKEGSDAYTVILSNEAHTMPASENGTVSSYAGSGTKVTVFKGITKLTGVSGTPFPSAGEFSIGRNVTTGSIVLGALSFSSGDIICSDASNMTSDLAIVQYNVYIGGTSIVIEKRQSISKSKQGYTGEVGKTVRYTNWKSGVEYFTGDVNDKEANYNPSKFLDYVTYKSSGGTVRAYKCIAYHVSDVTTEPPNSSYWTLINYTAALATDVLLANTAVVGGFLFSPAMDENGDAIAEANQFMRTTDSVTNPSIRLSGDGSGRLAGGAISWGATGSPVLDGIFKTISAEIGDFNVIGGKIVSSDGAIEFNKSNVQTLSDLKTANTETVLSESPSGAWTDTETTTKQATVATAQFTPTDSGIIKFRATVTPDTDMEYAGWKVYLNDEIGDYVVYSRTGIGSISGLLFEAPVTAGITYTLHVETDGVLSIGETYNNSATLIGEVVSPTVIKNYKQNKKTSIGNNGLYSFWGGSNYMYFSSSYGFEIIFGSYGLKLDNSGLRGSNTSGNTWAFDLLA